MTNKFTDIKSEEIKLNESGDVELSEELAGAVAGGFSPEEEDEEDLNGSCPTLNAGCGKKLEK